MSNVDDEVTCAEGGRSDMSNDDLAGDALDGGRSVVSNLDDDDGDTR